MTSASAVNDQLWVDKYKPRSSRELVGNTTLVATLQQWLHDWADGSKTSKKAVLLSGAPGIGKTSAAHIISR